MKVRNIISGSFLLTAAFALIGCGGDSPTEIQQPDAAETPADVVDSITITGNDQMQFSPTEFTVRAGSEVEIIFHNIGQMPKESMGHNLVVLAQGTDVTAFANAAVQHQDNAYIPPEMEDQVIAATDILGPDEQETLTFTAPDEPGENPFSCTFPGHTAAGMVGVMNVVE